MTQLLKRTTALPSLRASRACVIHPKVPGDTETDITMAAALREIPA